MEEPHSPAPPPATPEAGYAGGRGDRSPAAQITQTRGSEAASSSSASSLASASRSSRWPLSLRKGVRLRRRRRRRRVPLASRCGGGGGCDDGVQDLALPLGMSFAAVLAQVLDKKNFSGERLPLDFLSKICTSAVKESLTNIYGDRFDSFMRNFEKSFGSTLRTLHLINETAVCEQRSAPRSSFKHDGPVISCKLGSVTPQSLIQEVQENILLNTMENQLIPHEQANQAVAHISQSRSNPEFNQHILSTFEKSVREQARSNDLKEYEIGLNMRKMQLKQSQLALHSYSHALEKIKISMGFDKFSFKKEKFSNQMQDTKHAELLKGLIDLLVTGVIVMSTCFGYGTYIYSYERITALTSACTAASKEPKSWWVPKSVASFNSGWLFLRCHLVALTRISFGILMILAIAWLIFQRSAMVGPTMPITFNIMLLGIFCGFAGKLCVETLGADGCFWLVCWWALCLLHFVGNVRPSVFYGILYGPISPSCGNEIVRLPYCLRRYIFYAMLLLVLPISAGLLPFASFSDWKEHFTEKIKHTFVASEIEP